MNGEPTNAERHNRIFGILENVPPYNEQDPGSPGQEGIDDLLADIMHFCRIQDLDFEKSLTTARIHFEAEITEEEAEESRKEESE